MSLRAITTFVVMVAILALGFMISVAVFDPLLSMALGYDLGGMGGIVENIHSVPVKWMVPVGIATFGLWAVFFILRRERQTIR